MLGAANTYPLGDQLHRLMMCPWRVFLLATVVPCAIRLTSKSGWRRSTHYWLWNENKRVEQGLDDKDRQTRFQSLEMKTEWVYNQWKQAYHIYSGVQKSVGCWWEVVDQTHRVVEFQHLDVTQGLQKLFKDTQWPFEQLSFVEGHKSVSASVWHDLLLKFGVKEHRIRIMKNLNLDRSLLVPRTSIPRTWSSSVHTCTRIISLYYSMI
jgi:hypothetical protein